MNYCTHCLTLPLDNIHRIHHDTIYGIGSIIDNELYGRLILEINQAGLSWNTILRRGDSFREAYSNFEINKIANYTTIDKQQLLQDARIIKHRLKIEAIQHNAIIIQKLQSEFGSWYQWIKTQECITIDQWVKVFKAHFKFVGKEIVNEFLMTIGRIDGAHNESCPQFQKYKLAQSIWR